MPAELNWDFWLGQAPKEDYEKERCHSQFRWWYDYAGGPVTDWGAHHNDIARWAIGQDGPETIEAKVVTGPIPGGYTTPSEYEATLNWANGITQIVKTTLDDTPFGGSLIKMGRGMASDSRARTAGSGSIATGSRRAMRILRPSHCRRTRCGWKAPAIT